MVHQGIKIIQSVVAVFMNLCLGILGFFAFVLSFLSFKTDAVLGLGFLAMGLVFFPMTAKWLGAALKRSITWPWKLLWGSLCMVSMLAYLMWFGLMPEFTDQHFYYYESFTSYTIP